MSDERADLSTLAPKIAASFVSLASDIALVLGPDGTIQSISQSGSEPVSSSPEAWIGRRWVDTVTVETRPKVEQLLREVALTGASRPRQVNHPAGAGPDIPITYTAIRLGERGPVLAVGRDLRAVAAIQQRFVEAQQAMERDYWQMRQAETRYRLMFQLATEALLVVSGDALRIVDANTAAARLLDLPADKLVGKPATFGLDPGSEGTVQDMLAASRLMGRAGEVRVRLAGSRAEVRVSATAFRSDGALLLLVRARPIEAADAGADVDAQIVELAAETPHAMAIVDDAGRVRYANRAFAELVELPGPQAALGRPLDEWLGHARAEVSTILARLRSHGDVRSVSMAIRGALGRSADVELSGVLLGAAGAHRFGFILRESTRALPAAGDTVRDLAAAVESLTQLVGRVSLPDLVRDTTDLVERHIIRHALAVTGDKRTAAAELLGLSRQSLYVKLRRHRLQADDSAEDERPTTDPH